MTAKRKVKHWGWLIVCSHSAWCLRPSSLVHGEDQWGRASSSVYENPTCAIDHCLSILPPVVPCSPYFHLGFRCQNLWSHGVSSAGASESLGSLQNGEKKTRVFQWRRKQAEPWIQSRMLARGEFGCLESNYIKGCCGNICHTHKKIKNCCWW